MRLGPPIKNNSQLWEEKQKWESHLHLNVSRCMYKVVWCASLCIVKIARQVESQVNNIGITVEKNGFQCIQGSHTL